MAFCKAQENQASNCVVFVCETLGNGVRKQRENTFACAAPDKDLRLEEANAPNPVIAKGAGALCERVDVLQRCVEIPFFELEAYARVFFGGGNGSWRLDDLLAAEQEKK
jgi:hypothetical protein